MNPDDNNRKLAYSIAEAVEASGIGRTLIFAEIKAGRLQASKCGRRTIIPFGELQRWLKSLPRVKREPDPA